MSLLFIHLKMKIDLFCSSFTFFPFPLAPILLLYIVSRYFCTKLFSLSLSFWPQSLFIFVTHSARNTKGAPDVCSPSPSSPPPSSYFIFPFSHKRAAFFVQAFRRVQKVLSSPLPLQRRRVLATNTLRRLSLPRVCSPRAFFRRTGLGKSVL